MDLFRVNQLIDSLEKKYKPDYPRLADYIKPGLRGALILTPSLAGLLYVLIIRLCWPYINATQLVQQGSEAENTLIYILVFIPSLCLTSIPFILPSCWVLENLSVTSLKITVERIGALFILLLMGSLVILMNGDLLAVLEPMTADRARVLSTICYFAVGLTFFICHWPSNRRMVSAK